MYHKGAIEGYPLQPYTSALLFSPTGSLIRQLFQHEEPEAISIRPALSDGWSACLQTLEGHNSYVSSVAFSHDSTLLASASWDKTVKIWDASSGACLQTLEGHSDAVRSVAFSHDSTRLASASGDKTVKIWDASSGACLQTLEGHSSDVRSVAFSHDSTRLASASGDKTVKIWDASSGACLQTLSVGRKVDRVSFDVSDTHLHTNIGLISIIFPPGFSPLLSVAQPRSPQYLSLALSANGVWITCDSQNLVWLPSEYRPLSSAVRWTENEEGNVPVLGVKQTTETSQLQGIGQTAKTILLGESSQTHPWQQEPTSLQIERQRPQPESEEASIYGGTTAGGGDSIFTGQTRVQSSISETGSEESTVGTLVLSYTKNDDDIRSLISEGDDNQSQASAPNTGRSSVMENAVVSLLATNSLLAPVYEKALQLMPKERFADNFRRILKFFHEDLKRLDETLVTQELAAILRSKEARKRIARKITDRHISFQNSFTEQDLQRVHRPDKTNLSYLESWLIKSNIPPLLGSVPKHFEIGEQQGPMPSKKLRSEFRMNEQDTSDEDDTSDEEERSNGELENGEGEQDAKDRPWRMGTAQFPRLDLVTQNLVEGEPFQDMVIRLKEFLLPDGLLRDILPIPRERITYDSQGSHRVLNAFQGLLEDLTGLEWNWWPLPPRMHPLSEGETRVFWQCVSFLDYGDTLY
jgi:hypothetical protein